MIRYAIAALFALLVVLPAQAQVKVGYADYELVIVQMEDYRKVQEQLKSQAEKDQNSLRAQQQVLEEKLQDYQQKQALLSAEAKQSREQELIKLQGQLQQAQQTKMQGLQQKEQELMGPLFERLQTAIDEISEAEGLTMVFGVRAGGDPVVLYASDAAVDITTQIMEKLGVSLTQSGN